MSKTGTSELRERNWFFFKLWRLDFETSKLLYSRFRRGRSFSVQGKTLPYLPNADRAYNSPWRNEREVEIPFFQDLVASYDPSQILEVGNVLSYYMPVTHDVVDKYESGPNVRSVDVVEFDPGKTYDLIISISTLEHVGFDEEPKEPGKAHRAIDHLRRLLRPGGKLVFSVPIGHNPEINSMVAQEDVPFMSLVCLKRSRWGNTWREAPKDKIKNSRYNYWTPTARAIAVGTIGATA